ncbi:hypothetical protein H4S07_000101 [Coemansia furcata]|uniref:Uncharacterized protein n=1 Tax=Coemansia furcata TaxID=417177 RepID=A0ACC1LT14_9FUNG|nr:hypothetical protein H4S07_000101 [Coemansia furcata]
MVVTHLVGNILLLTTGVTPGTIEYKMLLMPLLWICRNFRAEAAAIFYKVNAQDIGNRYDDFYYCREEQDGSSCRLQNFYQSLHPLTREVHLLLDNSSIYFGQALKPLSRAPLDSWNFQEIRKLKLEFYVPQWQQDEWDARQAEMDAVLEQVNTKSEYYDWLNEKRQEIKEHRQKVAPTVMANISEFVCQIKQMVPTLRKIELEYDIHEFEQDPETISSTPYSSRSYVLLLVLCSETP